MQISPNQSCFDGPFMGWAFWCGITFKFPLLSRKWDISGANGKAADSPVHSGVLICQRVPSLLHQNSVAQWLGCPQSMRCPWPRVSQQPWANWQLTTAAPPRGADIYDLSLHLTAHAQISVSLFHLCLTRLVPHPAGRQIPVTRWGLSLAHALFWVCLSVFLDMGSDSSRVCTWRLRGLCRVCASGSLGEGQAAGPMLGVWARRWVFRPRPPPSVFSHWVSVGLPGEQLVTCSH